MATDRFVDVRTWPERTDVLVVDPRQAVALAHFPLNPLCQGALWDPSASYLDRAQAAMDILVEDNEYLQASFHTDGERVSLSLDLSGRSRMQDLLSAAGLTLADVEFDKIKSAEAKLIKIDLDTLFRLLCDWHDIVERHCSAGLSLSEEDSWAQRSAPDNCHLYHYLSGDQGDEEAYMLFDQLNNVDIVDFTLGHMLRWVYYSRAEFAQMPYNSPSIIRA